MIRSTPAADAAPIGNAAVPLPERDLKAISGAPRVIDEKVAAVIDTPDILEAAIAKPPFAFTAGDSTAVADTRANADGNGGGPCPVGRATGVRRRLNATARGTHTDLRKTGSMTNRDFNRDDPVFGSTKKMQTGQARRKEGNCPSMGMMDYWTPNKIVERSGIDIRTPRGSVSIPSVEGSPV